MTEHDNPFGDPPHDGEIMMAIGKTHTSAPWAACASWPTYARTKLADLLLTFELDERARAMPPVQALAAHPGLSATGLMTYGEPAHLGGWILDAGFALLGQPASRGRRGC